MPYQDQFPAAYQDQFPVDPTIPARPDTIERGAPSDQTAAGVRAKGPTEPLAKWGIGALPTVGGFVGDVGGAWLGGLTSPVTGAAGPYFGSVGGATVLGGAGEAVKQRLLEGLGYAEPMTPQESMDSIKREAAIQGASAGVGRLASGVVRAAARPMMEKAIRPTTKMVQKYGDIAGTALEKRLKVGKLPWSRGKTGGEQAGEKVAEASAAGDRILSGMTRQFSAQDVRPEIDALLVEVRKQPAGNAERRAIEKLAREFYKVKRAPMSAVEFNEMKRAAQSKAKTVYGSGAEAAEPAAAKKFNLAVADGARRVLEAASTTRSGVNVLGAANNNTRRLLAAERAIRRAETKPTTFEIPGLPKAAGEFLGPGAAEVYSRLALLADDPRFLFALSQAPRAGATLLGSPPDTTR